MQRFPSSEQEFESLTEHGMATLGKFLVHQCQDAALATDWKDLLDSVGWENVSMEAIASSCTI